MTSYHTDFSAFSLPLNIINMCVCVCVCVCVCARMCVCVCVCVCVSLSLSLSLSIYLCHMCVCVCVGVWLYGPINFCSQHGTAVVTSVMVSYSVLQYKYISDFDIKRA